MNNDLFREESNIIIKPIEKGDITEIEKNQKIQEQLNNIPSNTSFTNNNIFSSLSPGLRNDKEYSNVNNVNKIYNSFLAKELINYNLSNLFNIIKEKLIIIKTQTFYILKKISNNKVNNLIKAEILFLKISSSLTILSKIFKKNRKIILYHVLYILRNKNKTNDLFKLKFEIHYKKEKDNIINEYNIKLKIIEKETKDIEKKIKNLNNKENDLKIESKNLLKKEIKLKDKIKLLENFNNNNNNIVKAKFSNISSINNNSKYDSDIISLESTIETNKQLKEGKKEIINNFIYKINMLLNEYRVYLDMLKATDVNNNINIGNNSNSNQQSLTHKDKHELGNIWSKKSSGNQLNKLQNYNYNYYNNMGL